MYRIEYYRNDNGISEFEEYYNKLREKTERNKDARIRYNTISRYISFLQRYGTAYLPSDYAKQIYEDIWELRPDKYRIFYFFFKNDTYVLLNDFEKKTRKTPDSEIKRAIKERNDYVNRNKKRVF